MGTMAKGWWLGVVVLAQLTGGCSQEVLVVDTEATSGAGGDPGTTAGPGAGPGGPRGGAPAACVHNVVDLELTISPDGVADSQVVPVRRDGSDAYLAIDTGSPLTFVFGDPGDPEYVEHAADLEIGCERYPVASLTLEAIGPEPFNGRMIIGVLGMDFFSEVPSELDYPGARVVRHLDGEVPGGLTEVPVEWNGARILVDAALDDQSLRLIYDAGSPHTLWVGQDGQPGDEPIEVGTADGNTTPAFAGTASLDFAGERDQVIPVWRALELPYIAEELAELGADGLLGATGLGFRHVAFELYRSRIWLGPRVTP